MYLDIIALEETGYGFEKETDKGIRKSRNAQVTPFSVLHSCFFSNIST
jgi:hypothetical protein